MPNNATESYNNAVLSITSVPTPDPFVVHAHGKFYLTFTAGDHVEIWSAGSLHELRDRATVHNIWHPPPGNEYSNDIWAPELHNVFGRWHVYVAAAHPAHGNKSHRMFVLGGPAGHEDPCSGPWQLLGPVRGLPPDQWAIDGTIFSLGDGSSYFVYSGWPFGDFSDRMQQLFIVRMRDAVTAVTYPVVISSPHHACEFSDGDHGVNEGPQFLASPDGRWAGVVYSCAGSWTKDYKMMTLQYVGGDPLDARSWRKNPEPLIQSAGSDRGGRGPWGPGHGSFVDVGGEVVAVFHATDNEADGWANRRARMQRVCFGERGPYMGGYVGPHVGSMDDFTRGGMGQSHGQESEHGQGRGHGHFRSAFKSMMNSASNAMREL